MGFPKLEVSVRPAQAIETKRIHYVVYTYLSLWKHFNKQGFPNRSKVILELA